MFIFDGLKTFDGPKTLTKAIRATFGAAIQRCQLHKGRNIVERVEVSLQTGVKKSLRQVCDPDDADKAERPPRNLIRRLTYDEPGVAGGVPKGLDEILTVIRLSLSRELRRWLACANIIENAT